MISVQEALQTILNNTQDFGVEEIPFLESSEQTLRVVKAAISHKDFANELKQNISKEASCGCRQRCRPRHIARRTEASCGRFEPEWFIGQRLSINMYGFE